MGYLGAYTGTIPVLTSPYSKWFRADGLTGDPTRHAVARVERASLIGEGRAAIQSQRTVHGAREMNMSHLYVIPSRVITTRMLRVN
ncbi:hypothetical protein DPMN_138625 [Dreissena polymorpha]|uniref:Uncharacterized protein n=1 Tax=Dreissena polymorpha TaxID=45954 RepID=A0A9D4G471_DREPO|nr:hypothetical protein DPMN_138625 [Dreissena polymorpha]